MIHPFLIGERIYLRKLELGDLEGYLDWMNDQKVTKYMQMGIFPSNMEDMESYYKSIRGGLFLAIVKFGLDEHIGNIRLSSIHDTFRSAEISILIGKEQGQGYGTEAIKLLVDHCFMRMNINRLEAGMVDANIGCRRAFEKAGFINEGTRRSYYFCEGEYHNVYFYGLLKSDWERDRKHD